MSASLAAPWPSISGIPALKGPVALSATTQTREAIHAAVCFLSICLAFLVYGVLQERVMTVGFGSDRELFTSSLFVVFCNRLMTCTISFLAALIQPGGVKPRAPLQSYAAISFANLVASTCQYDSLKYVSFAMQTLAKCCKVLPVMAWGALLRRKRYPAMEVATAACVVAGCAAFIFTGSVLSKALSHAVTWQMYAMGCGLLLLYLGFDGFASTWQDRLFAGFEMDTSNQVLYTSLFSMLISLVVLLVTGEVAAVAKFLAKHPPAAMYITAVSSAATIIQYFVAYTIKTYGALNFATIMTARQFLSVIASCIIFKHDFTLGQWTGTFIVFAALAANVAFKRSSRLATRTGKMTSPEAYLPPRISTPPTRNGHKSDDALHIHTPVTVQSQPEKVSHVGAVGEHGRWQSSAQSSASFSDAA